MNPKNFYSGNFSRCSNITAYKQCLCANVTDNSIGKLVHAKDNYIQQALPYSDNFLEPRMDAETMHLHYTFHHGGAVKTFTEIL